MRAITFSRLGGLEAIELSEIALPVPGEGQVRVRVEAAALHPADFAAASGVFGPAVPADGKRRVLGWDAAGVIDAVGSDVDGYAVGDRVVALAFWLTAQKGTQAEYVLLDLHEIAKAPAQAGPAEAATLPLNGLTAWQALDLLDLPEGASVLITGAAGAVGGFALRLAALRGLRPVAVAGPQDEQLVREWGATGFVPRGTDLTAIGRVDGVLDAAVLGPQTIAAVRDGGAFVAVIDPAAPAPERGIRVAKVTVRPDSAQLTKLVSLVDTGDLPLRVAESHSLADHATAYARLAKGGLRGAVVLTV